MDPRAQAGQRMRFEFVDGFFVGAHTAEAPTSDEWRHHCEEIARRRPDTRGVLVFTLGGGPGSQQRRELRVAWGGGPPPPTVIMTASGIARGIITSLNWFFGNQNLVAVPPTDLASALEHFSRHGSPAPKSVVQALPRVAASIGVPVPAALRSER